MYFYIVSTTNVGKIRTPLQPKKLMKFWTLARLGPTQMQTWKLANLQNEIRTSALKLTTLTYIIIATLKYLSNSYFSIAYTNFSILK